MSNSKPEYRARRKRFSGRSSDSHFNKRRSYKKQTKPEKRINLEVYTQPANRDIKKASKSDLAFRDLDLHPELLKSIEEKGFSNPTEIQEKLIPKMLQGENVVAISQTGSGKTAAYLIPILNKILTRDKSAVKFQTLIIVPTRELAYQIEKELFDFHFKRHGLFSLVCIGGTDMRRQIRFARKHNDFVIGTPGRLIDLVEKGVLDLSKFDTLIVDEMDRMLDMGFIDDISWVIEKLPENIQHGFFSATLNKKIEPIIQRFAPKAPIVRVNHPKPSEYVDQTMVQINRNDDKFEALLEVLRSEKNKSIIFVSTKSETERVMKKLHDLGFDVHYLHGDRPQNHRTRVIRDYRRLANGILVATDVAARGLDIDDVTQVVNYDEPNTYEDYIHRIGRTGRAGKYGKAVTLVKRG